jgi:hypothetical protein
LGDALFGTVAEKSELVVVLLDRLVTATMENEKLCSNASVRRKYCHIEKDNKNKNKMTDTDTNDLDVGRASCPCCREKRIFVSGGGR